MEEDDEGEWVRYSDYAEVVTELEDVTRKAAIYRSVLEGAEYSGIDDIPNTEHGFTLGQIVAMMTRRLSDK